MKFIKFLEILMLLGSLTLICSQILIPALVGEALFPWFRRKARINNQIVEVEEEINTFKKEQELLILKQQLPSKEKATPVTEKPKRVRKTVSKTTKTKQKTV